MELIPTNRDFSLIIDYAHTPDGLEKVLSAVKEFAKGRVVVVFGCGGDRDNTKRPIMGEIADRLADFCVITSDNPRTEEPSGIIEQIVAGMNDIAEKIIIQDRRAAIRYAIENAKKDDVVILAGKGHEDYQILPTGKIHFDEHEVVEEILREEEEERANGEDNHR
jgi:UDP-N-acetylmuramoyl-L-alanyl-D-glutamate--2,6-diaminopimelate ligase